MIPHRASSSYGYLALAVLAAGLLVDGSARAQSACQQLGVDCTHRPGGTRPDPGPRPPHVPPTREIKRQEEKEKSELYDATMRRAIEARNGHNYQQARQLYLEAQKLHNTKDVRSGLAWVQGDIALTSGDKRTALAYYEESIKACRRCWTDKSLIPNLKQQLADEDRAARETLALQQLEAAAGTSSAGAKAAKTGDMETAASQAGTTFDREGSYQSNADVERALAADKDYQALAAHRAEAVRQVEKAQHKLDALNAKQNTETNPKKRQQNQIDISNRTMQLDKVRGEVAVDDVKQADAKKRIIYTITRLPAAASGQNPGSPEPQKQQAQPVPAPDKN